MIPRPCIALSAVFVLVSGLWSPLRAQSTGPAEVIHEKGQSYLRLQMGAAGEIGASALPSGRLIVKLRPGRDQAFLRAMPGARKLGSLADLLLVPVPPGQEAGEAARRLAQRSDVLYAEPDSIASLALVPNDTRWSEQWDLVKIGAPTAWDTQTDSSDVVVAVLDTGINFSHPDLQNNLWTDPLDGSHGFTCLNGTVTPGGLDDNGHGTHVAGVLGATGNDGLGVAGVNWSVRLLSLKAFDAAGTGSLSDIVSCIDKLTELKQSGVNVRVANHSWTVFGFSQALEDALARAENAGVLHVCAAGNSGRDLDIDPYYPAAFDGRGILAVAATDSGDVPASFTNFGEVRVDLAAPGVNVLSTVPSGSCTYCDASAYKLLSGTSMASPHVAGVAAALFHRNPALTPAEVRDVLLQPASTDVLTSNVSRAYSTTHARLSFAKALVHPWVLAPQLNGFPQLSFPSQFTRPSGSLLTLAPAASDAEGDPLSFKVGRKIETNLNGLMMNQVLLPGTVYPPFVNTHLLAFRVPSFAIPATTYYVATVNDGRGGSALAWAELNLQANPTPGQAPSGTLTVTPASGPPGTVVTVSYSGTDPEGGSILWGHYSAQAGGYCCTHASQTFTYTLNETGTYRFTAQSIDRELNLSALSTATVHIGNAVGDPPVPDLVLDVSSGPAPLTVSYDATGSYDPDGGGALTYFPVCGSQDGWIVLPQGPPTGTCTFTEPGPNVIDLWVKDASGAIDRRTAYVMVLGNFAPDTTAPTVQLTSPAAGASLTGTVTLSATASDNESVNRVEFYRDSAVLLGTDYSAPFSVTWNTGPAFAGPHTLYAKAYDDSESSATSQAVSVSVPDTLAPSVSVTGPAQGSTLPNNATATLSASASDNVGVARVELYRDAEVLLGTDTTAPYSLAWNPATTTVGSHTLYAKAFDAAGNSATAAAVSVTVVDATPPAVSITSPANGGTVSRNTTLTIAASASDDVGVARVEFLVNGALACTDTTSPYTCSWKVPKPNGASYSLQAKAYDARNNVGTSSVVQVTAR